MTERDIFIAAAQIESPGERAAFLDRACGGDQALQERISGLLAEQDKLGSFLNVPAAAVATIEREPPAGERLGMQIGPYKLLQKLGEGGMGSVYLAEQQQPVKRQVALKIIKAGMDSAQVIARFEQERQALAIMDHPHIAKVLDAGTTESGRPYFVMELVKGIPITRYCDQDHLSPKERLELFIPVCQAVQHAHQKGIIHRDLKPSNVLIALYDGRPIPKVIDFGVAKATCQKLTERTLFTEVGSIVGTLEYMAPEQAELNNLDIDTRADIYSLGVLLYELLTGAPPFSGQQLRSAGFNEMLRIIKEVEPQKPSTKLSSSAKLPSIAANRKLEPARLTKLVRGDLDWIVMKCLEKERGRRYETANAFAMDIQRYLADEPVLAGPPSAAYRLKKFLRRNKGPALAAAIVLLTLVSGVIGTTWGLIRAENSRRAAEREKRVSQAVTGFLQDSLLNQADAQHQADTLLRLSGTSADARPNPTIRELLDRAAGELTPTKIDAQFPGMPLVQAGILRTIGNTYGGIGQYQTALAHLERAREIYVSQLGPDHPDTLTTLHNLACVYKDDGKSQEAIQLFEQVRDKRVVTLGPNHPDTLTTLYNLAEGYQATSRLADAIRLFQQVREKRTAALGADHADTLATVSALALAYNAAWKFSDAIQLFEHVRDKQAAKLGPDHPHTLRTMNGLARAYHGAKKLPEAMRLYQQARDKAVAVLGPHDPVTLRLQHGLATTYQAAGRSPEAISLYEQVRDQQVAKYGLSHPETLATLNSLAAAYREAGRTADVQSTLEQVREGSLARLGSDNENSITELHRVAGAYLSAKKYSEAARAYEQVRDQWAAKLGKDHENTLLAINGLAWSYLYEGRTDEAIELFEDVRSRLTAQYGSQHGGLLSNLNGLAQAYGRAKKWPEAIRYFEQVRDQHSAKDGPHHSSTLSLTNSLASSLSSGGKLTEALQVWEDLVPKAQKSLGHTHASTMTYMRNWCRALDEVGEYSKAVEIRRELVKLERAQLSATDSRLADALELQGQSFLKAGNTTEAEMAFRESLAIREQATPTDWQTCNARSLLGGALAGQKKYADAEPLQLSGYEGLKERESKIPVAFRTLRLTEALQRLIDLYTAWDKPDEADKWRKMLAGHQAAASPPPPIDPD